MKNVTQKQYATALAIIVALIVVVLFARHSSVPSQENAEMSGPTLSMATTSMSGASSTAADLSLSSNPGQIFAYYLNIATTTFSQNQLIPMTLFVYNLSSTTQMLNFKDGCQGTYSVGGFDMIKHTTCLPAPSSFSIAPHSVRQISLTHYPSVYQIPIGTYSLFTGVVGYGGITTQVTITK